MTTDMTTLIRPQQGHFISIYETAYSIIGMLCAAAAGAEVAGPVVLYKLVTYCILDKLVQGQMRARLLLLNSTHSGLRLLKMAVMGRQAMQALHREPGPAYSSAAFATSFVKRSSPRGRVG